MRFKTPYVFAYFPGGIGASGKFSGAFWGKREMFEAVKRWINIRKAAEPAVCFFIIYIHVLILKKI